MSKFLLKTINLPVSDDDAIKKLQGREGSVSILDELSSTRSPTVAPVKLDSESECANENDMEVQEPEDTGSSEEQPGTSVKLSKFRWV